MQYRNHLLHFLKRCVIVLILSVIVSLFFLNTKQTAFAIQDKPPTSASYYISSTSTTDAYGLGCTQGATDAYNGYESVVVLDFGGQLSDGSGTLKAGSSITTFSNSQIKAVAESFALGYYDCELYNDSYGQYHLTLALGTNNSNGDVSYSGGQAWVNLTAEVANDLWNDDGVGATIMGANDIETSWSSATDARAWADGFYNNTVSAYNNFGAVYYDYGDAGGCPSNSSSNGSCNNGWDQDDVYYVSYGAPAALPLPEIYYSVNAQQWTMVDEYGGIWVVGPLDEYPADNTTLTSSQAWDDLWTDLNNNIDTSQDLNVSTEIQWQ